MTIRNRLDKLNRAIGGPQVPGQLDLLVCMPVGDGLEPHALGVSFNVDGKVATVLHEGHEPDESVVAPLRARLATWGLTIRGGPRVIPPPLGPEP